MDNQPEQKESSFKLLQPELLSEDELSQILKSLCVSQNLNTLSQEQLIILFKKVALPLPQRQYTDSWRGKMLTAQRLKHEKKTAQKRKISVSGSTKDSNGVHPKSQTSSPKERLKPPVDMINYQRKTIKLVKSSNNSSSKISSYLDKIVIKDRRKEKLDSKSQETTVQKSEHLDKIIINNRAKGTSEGKIPVMPSGNSKDLDNIIIKDRRKDKAAQVSKSQASTIVDDCVNVKDELKECANVKDELKECANVKDELKEKAKTFDKELDTSKGGLQLESTSTSDSLEGLKKVKLKRTSFSEQIDTKTTEKSESSQPKKRCI